MSDSDSKRLLEEQIKVGRFIKKRRLELNMTQEELALKSGFGSKASISQIESGKHGIPKAKILLVAKALKTKPEYIMGWSLEDTNEPYEIIRKIYSNNDLMNLVKASVDLPADTLRLLTEIIKKMK